MKTTAPPRAGGLVDMRAIHPSSSRGFTLVEMVVVISVVALLVGIAAPRLVASTDRYKVELAARRIAADLALARSQASMSSSAQTVSFNVSGGSYTMAGITSLDGKSTNYVLNLGADPYDCGLAAVNFNGGQQVTFDAYGSADNGGQIIVQRNGYQMTVTVEASSGKATVP